MAQVNAAASGPQGRRLSLVGRAAGATVLGGRRVLGRLMRGVPGLAALGCAVSGVWLQFGLAWALLAAVPFLLVLDARMP